MRDRTGEGVMEWRSRGGGGLRQSRKKALEGEKMPPKQIKIHNDTRLNLSLIFFPSQTTGCSCRISLRRRGSWPWLRPRLWWPPAIKTGTARSGWKVRACEAFSTKSRPQMRRGAICTGGAVHYLVLKLQSKKKAHTKKHNESTQNIICFFARLSC